MQPVALFTVLPNGHQLRQTVESAKYYEWDLDFGVIVDQFFMKRFEMGEMIDVCSQIVRGNDQQQVQLKPTGTFEGIIKQLSETKNLENGIICSLKADINQRKFPSSEGLSILSLIKAAPIIQRYKNKPSKQVGQKIKIRLMVKFEDFQDELVRDKLQSLSQDLTKEIVVKRKIVIGSSWIGRFYFGKSKQVKQYERDVNWEMEQNVTKNVSEHEYYINYDAKDRSFPSLSEAQEHEAQEHQENKENAQELSTVEIGITGFKGIYTGQTAQYFGSSLFDLVTLPKMELSKWFKFEESPGMNRLKCWWKRMPYYYDCQTDRAALGKFFNQAMKIGGGVRSYIGVPLPPILIQLQTVLLQVSILERESDCVAINLYKDPRSGINFHGEDDRYVTVTGCVFCSDGTVTAFFSINQSGINGTTEVDIESTHLSIWRFDS